MKRKDFLLFLWTLEVTFFWNSVWGTITKEKIFNVSDQASGTEAMGPILSKLKELNNVVWLYIHFYYLSGDVAPCRNECIQFNLKDEINRSWWVAYRQTTDDNSLYCRSTTCNSKQW